MRIGIFDSGVGGLTVLKSIHDKYPNNEYFYVGDNKYNPYGEKTKEQLFCYASRIIDYFITKNINLIVIACNTICSNIFDKLKDKYKNITLIGVIDSTIKDFIKRNKKNVLVIATTGTIKSNVYENRIKNINSFINIYSLATPELVPLIEKRIDTKDTINNYLSNYKDIDSIILGCTHYKLIEQNISKNIEIINSSDGVVNDINKYIKNSYDVVNIYTTGNEEEFNKFCKLYMNIKSSHIDIL